MNTLIIGISGKKQSGKDTVINGLIPLLKNYGSVNTYTFADSIKSFCIDILGLSNDQVWGTDEDKNSSTDYYWENIPDYIRWDFAGRWTNLGGFICQNDDDGKVEKIYNEMLINKKSPIKLMEGTMTARHVMQVWGTDICRDMFGENIWVNDLFNRVEKHNPAFALIPDLRFPSELKAVKVRNGFVIRLLRNVKQGDEHPSEIALDDWNWDKCKNTLVVPEDATIDGCLEMSFNWLSEIIRDKP